MHSFTIPQFYTKGYQKVIKGTPTYQLFNFFYQDSKHVLELRDEKIIRQINKLVELSEPLNVSQAIVNGD